MEKPKKKKFKKSKKDAGKVTKKMPVLIGGQPGNKNAEKWTETEAIKLAEDLITWMLPKYEIGEDGKRRDIHVMNIFVKNFLLFEKFVDDDLVTYLSKKFSSFSEKIKKAKDMQEQKLVNLAVYGKSPTGAMFYLNSKYAYRKNIDVDQNVKATISMADLAKSVEKVEKEG